MTYIHHTPGTTDDLLVSWYMTLLDSGDLYSTFMEPMHNVSGFFAGVAPMDLVFGVEGAVHEVWCAVWVEPMGGSPFMGVWIAEPWRGSIRAARFILTWHEHLCAAYPIHLALTRQDFVVELALSLGYNTHGWVPGLWAGYPAHLLSTTPESRAAHQQQKEATHGRRRQRRRQQTGVG